MIAPACRNTATVSCAATAWTLEVRPFGVHKTRAKHDDNQGPSVGQARCVVIRWQQARLTEGSRSGLTLGYIQYSGIAGKCS
jgi:hypothetical protein